MGRSPAATGLISGFALAGIAGTGSRSVSDETVVGVCGVSIQTHPGVAQSCSGAGAVGQHGCAAEPVTVIEAQNAIGFNRKATVRITRPNFVLAFMASFGCTYLHVSCR